MTTGKLLPDRTVDADTRVAAAKTISADDSSNERSDSPKLLVTEYGLPSVM